jgi:hypothetical protein
VEIDGVNRLKDIIKNNYMNININNFCVNLLLNDDKNELYIEILNNNSNINFKYELYGNKNFYCNGLIKCKNCFIPTLKLKILDDNLFFLKVKIFNKNVSHSTFKFFDINDYIPEENLSMIIEDTDKKKLFDSITLNTNLQNESSEDETEDQP